MTCKFRKIQNNEMEKNMQIAEIFIIPTDKAVYVKECIKYPYPLIFLFKNACGF